MYTDTQYSIIFYIITVTWILNTVISYTNITVTWTLLFHVLVSSLHKHSSTLNIAISYRHWLYCTLLFHIFVSLITLIRYTCTCSICITVTQVLYTIIICTHHMDSSVYMHWLFLYSCCRDHCYITWIIATWIFLYSRYMTVSHYWCWYSITRYECCCFVMCETKCHVDLSRRGHSKIPHLLFLFSVILFYVINRAHVHLSCNMYHALLSFLINCAVLIG